MIEYEYHELSITEISLTKRELECLSWVGEGKTSWEVSRILDISERTVVFHLQNAAMKLKAKNRMQAVARAVYLGFIVPEFM